MLFTGGLKLNLKPGFETPISESINFATRLPDGTLKIESLTPKELSDKTGQSFQWTNTVLVDEKATLPVIPDSRNISEASLKYAFEKSHEIQKKMAIIKINDIVGYGAIALEEINAGELAGLYAGVYLMNTVDIISLSENSDLDVLSNFQFQSPLVIVKKQEQLYLINRLRETITELFPEKEAKQAFLNQLQIVPIETLTTLPLEEIESTLSMKVIERDDYGIGSGAENFLFSGKHFRNFIPFCTHAFAIKNPYGWPAFEPSLNNFQPKDKTISQKTWHETVLSANLENINKCFSYNNVPFTFMRASQSIKAGEILSWNYSIRYWHGRNIAPVTLSKEGDIIDPSTYICTQKEYRDFLNSSKHEQDAFISETSVHSKMLDIIREIFSQYLESMKLSEQPKLALILEKKKRVDIGEFYLQIVDKVKAEFSTVYYTDSEISGIVKNWIYSKQATEFINALIDELSPLFLTVNEEPTSLSWNNNAQTFFRAETVSVIGKEVASTQCPCSVS